jgi:xanthine dehydrogenase iron-sulfur cluster and FAD-binding subunit A
VNAAFRVSWSGTGKSKIKEFRLAMGGIAATPLRLKKTELSLKGRALTPEQLSRSVAILHSEMEPLADLRGTTAFRRVLVENLFLKFFREQGGAP